MFKNVMTASAFMAVFLSACAPQQADDPAAPSQYIEVDPPEWTQGLALDVKKHSCNIKTNGQTYPIERGATNIGANLYATRDFNDCYVQDAGGVECDWGINDQIKSCRVQNPARNAYESAKHNVHF